MNGHRDRTQIKPTKSLTTISKRRVKRKAQKVARRINRK